MRRAWVLLIALVAPASLAGQSPGCDAPGAARVVGLEFHGNRALPDDTLAAAIELRRSAGRVRRLLRTGEVYCATSRAITEDLARLILLYRRRGFPEVLVDTVIERPRQNDVRVSFQITEGEPIVAARVDVAGVADDTLRDALARELALKAGDPLDRLRLEASRLTVASRLRQRAYLNARADTSTTIDSTSRSGTAAVDVHPGPLVRLGTLSIQTTSKDGGAPRVSADELRHLVGLSSGDLLGTVQLDKARRTLYDTGVQQDVEIRVDSVRSDGDGTGTADVRISAVEGSPNEFKLNGGWGTIDCFRLEAAWQRVAVIVPTGRFQVQGWASKIGIGDPLDVAPGLCSEATHNDPYSSELNYHLGVTYGLPAIGTRLLSWSASVYTERRSEYLAYLETTYIGSTLSASRAFGPWSVTLSHRLTYGRTQAEPAVLCATFSACLPEDRERATEPGSLGVLSTVVSHDGTDSPIDPTHGGTLRGELRAGLPWLGTSADRQFIGGRGDVTYFFPASKTVILAARVRGALMGNVGSGTALPQQERLYAGGANTIRGFGQNLAGPRVYIVDSVHTVVQGSDTLFSSNPADPGSEVVPTGGNSLLVGNIEVRLRPGGPGSILQLVGFLDAGALWQRGATTDDLRFTGIALTPGIGVRAFTPVGPVRLDIGYNPYSPRAGPAYRDTPLGLASAPLYCVSPGNTLKVTGVGAVDASGNPVPPVQDIGTCPATFAPASPSNFFDRLVLHFSIGQAF